LLGHASHRRTVSGLNHRIGVPGEYVPGSRKGVLMVYGHGTEDSLPNLDDAFGYLDPIHDAGFVTAQLDDTPCLWGNSTVRTNLDTLNASIADLVDTGSVHLFGASAGGTAVLNWAKANATLVRSIALVIPCVNVQGVHAENRGGFAAEVTTAYGGAPPDAENPLDFAADLSGIPIKMWVSETDTITTMAESKAFAEASGAELVNMGAQGHLFTAPFSGEALAAFYEANA
jgi:predicted alpha/beta hydrolase family esterase